MFDRHYSLSVVSTVLFMLYMSGTTDAEERTFKETVLISLVTCCAEPMFVADMSALSTGEQTLNKGKRCISQLSTLLVLYATYCDS